MTALPIRRSFALLALVGMPLAGCGGGRSAPARVEGGGLVLEASVSPPDLRVGENQLWLELRDAAGRPVDGAHLEARVRMHAMGAMPAMGGPASVEALGKGRYRADFELAMGGTWQVEVAAHAADGAGIAAEGSVTVGTPGVHLESTTGTASAAETGAEGAAEPGAAGAEPESAPGEFRFDPSRLRQIGVRSEPPRREAIAETVRAWGRVAWDETALRDVTLRVPGYVGRVEADALGDRVEQGQVLFWLYGPDLYAAQREYLEALRSRAAARGTSAPGRADPLVRAAERRLRLWEIAPGDVAAIARRGAPEEYLPIRAPVSGWVVEKAIVAGSAVEAGTRAYRIAPLDHVWIEAEVYESELPFVAVGQPAEVTLPYVAGRRFQAKVAWVYPELVGTRRTAKLRLELANPDQALRPDMYANVFLRSDRPPQLTVPESAVLYAGERSFVFVDLGDGRLRPQQVETGARGAGRVEILSGLAEDQPVVTAGTFLVASESRLRAALEAWQ